jgi:hypothetical protein
MLHWINVQFQHRQKFFSIWDFHKFQNMKACSLVDTNQRVGKSCFLHLQGRSSIMTTNQTKWYIQDGWSLRHSFNTTSKPCVQPIKLHIEWVAGTTSTSVSGYNTYLTTHLHPAQRSRRQAAFSMQSWWEAYTH